MPARILLNTRLFDRVETLDFMAVSRSFNGTCAVRDLSFSIAGGELITLVGGSGSGKTTTLRMVNRLIDPDSGEIRINGMPVSSLNVIALRRSVGYVIQQIGLFPHLTVAENISIPLRLAGVHPQDFTARIDQLLTLVSLPPVLFRDRRPAELSGGQQQRVGLARALAADPPILLMDEPFGALDPLLRRQLQDEFLRIKTSLRKTILFVTHDIDEALLLGDRVAVLRDGTLIFLGTPVDLLVAARMDSYLSTLTGGERLCRIRSAPVSILAARTEEIVFRHGQDETGWLDSSIREGGIRGAILEGPDMTVQALLPDPGSATGVWSGPVIQFNPDTSIQEALSRFSRTSARIALIGPPASRKVVFLEDLIGFFSGADPA